MSSRRLGSWMVAVAGAGDHRLAAGAAAARALRLRRRERGIPPAPGAAPLPSEAVLVTSPHARASSRLGAARRAMESAGIRITAQLDIQQLDELPGLTGGAGGRPGLVIAAGGDGTVGSVADRLAGNATVLGVLRWAPPTTSRARWGFAVVAEDGYSFTPAMPSAFPGAGVHWGGRLRHSLLAWPGSPVSSSEFTTSVT